MTQPIDFEFSRSFAVDRLRSVPVIETIEATPDERRRLAERFGLAALDKLTAALTLHREAGGAIRVQGRLEADVVQNCVVTLEPFPSHIEDGFAADFIEAPIVASDEELADPEYEPPEPVVNGAIDLGELTAQYLSLAIDPHPRAPGAALDPAWTAEKTARTSPFEALKVLKPRT